MFSLLDIGIAILMFAVLTAPLWSRDRRFDMECITCTVGALWSTVLIFFAAYSIRRPIAMVVIASVLLLYLFNFISNSKSKAE